MISRKRGDGIGNNRNGVTGGAGGWCRKGDIQSSSQRE